MESKLFNADYEQQDRDQGSVLRNIAVNSGVIVIGSSAPAKLKVATAIAYMINGYWKSLTGAPTEYSLTACAVQAKYTRCRYLVSVDAAGNVITTKGSEVRSLTTGALTTLSVVAIYKKIFDSASGLGSFKKGDKILVSGFTNAGNNGIFTVMLVDDAGGWIQVKENCQVDENAGASVTTLVESQLPDLPAGTAAICIITVTNTSATFTAGTTALTTVGAFTNIGLMPADE